MGLFKKKPDAVSERARQLNAEIAALEAQIKKLSSAGAERVDNTPPAPAVVPAKPRPAGSLSTEPIFERVDKHRLKEESEPGFSRSRLGAGKDGRFDPAVIWRRLMDIFRGPPPVNPKLVNYLAAGGIHGLRPLRYEKRVARYRLIFLCGCLLFALWIIVALVRRL